jgi:hypothetical protein
MKQPKERRCKSRTCRASFTPKQSGLSVQKYCSAACELDDAQSGIALKPKPKPKKPKTVAALKKELWPIFSLHQKLVHSDDGEHCNCYTCDARIKIGTSDCQGGHNFSKAACPNIYWDERCVRPQCNKCNSYYGGMHYEFNERLKQEIGLESWQEMYDNRKQVNKYSRQWFEEKIEYYKAEVKRIKELKNAPK